ncbi:MAG TPA: hypothetical protein VKH41_07345 [Myxococcota bacterium]|nr:hypothetical protein [Myxococcota bacterium]
MACQTPAPGVPGPPRGCIEERAWPGGDAVARERAEVCAHPPSADALARCQREQYLESTCREINTYRGDAGFDPELANFDVRFPWAEFQWISRELDLSHGHTGSESWADHLGLAGFHDNPIKRKRRAVMNVLTFGLAQRWYDARGLGTPPD